MCLIQSFIRVVSVGQVVLSLLVCVQVLVIRPFACHKCNYKVNFHLLIFAHKSLICIVSVIVRYVCVT